MQEKVAQRGGDGWPSGSVPVDVQAQTAQRFGRPIFDRHPNAINDSWARDVGQDMGSANGDRLERVPLRALVLARSDGLGACWVLRTDPLGPLVSAIPV